MNKKVIAATNDPKFLEEVRRTVGSRASVEQLNGSVRDALPTQSTGALIIDGDLYPANDERMRVAMKSPHTIYVANCDVASTAGLIAEFPSLGHILAHNCADISRQLHITLEHLLGASQPAFRQYLQPDTLVTSVTLNSTDAKQPCINRIVAAAETVDGFNDLPSLLATIASELIMNAIFNAPHDARDGKAIYRDRARDVPITLMPGQDVDVAFGHDDHIFALSVKDRFGKLTREHIASNFLRSSAKGDEQVNMKTQGAGVGLYMVLASTTQLDVRVHPGKSTEIIAILAISKRYRDFAKSGHSINMYFNEGGGQR